LKGKKIQLTHKSFTSLLKILYLNGYIDPDIINKSREISKRIKDCFVRSESGRFYELIEADANDFIEKFALIFSKNKAKKEEIDLLKKKMEIHFGKFAFEMWEETGFDMLPDELKLLEMILSEINFPTGK